MTVQSSAQGLTMDVDLMDTADCKKKKLKAELKKRKSDSKNDTDQMHSKLLSPQPEFLRLHCTAIKKLALRDKLF